MKAKPYTKREDSLIVEYLPKIGYPGLIKMLPQRSHCGLVDRVKTLRSRGVEIGHAYIATQAQMHEVAKSDELTIKEHLTTVGYRGLLRMMPNRSYHWLKNRIYMMRESGELTPDQKVPKFRNFKPKKVEPIREFSTAELPRTPGWRHERYMRGEVVCHESV